MSSRVPRPLDLDSVLRQTVELGLTVLQICDYPAIEALTSAELRDLRERATRSGITLELGTRGIAPEHLRKYRRIATELGAGILRSMLYSDEYRPTAGQTERNLRETLYDFEEHGITLALETYEQVRTEDLLGIVDRIDSPNLGVCLDPGNTVAALELPNQIIKLTADRVVNLHVKDFAFIRNDGMVGFTLAGCPLGEGLLDYSFLIDTIKPQSRGINQIIELWLPWQGDAETTCSREEQWAQHAVDFLMARTAEVAPTL